MRGRDYITEIVARWRAAGIEPRPGVVAPSIDELERVHALALPAEMRRSYATADGMEDAGDITSPRIWPLSELELEGALLEFADWVLDSHTYSIDVESGGEEVFLTWGGEPIFVCRGFGEFLRLVLDESDELFPSRPGS